MRPKTKNYNIIIYKENCFPKKENGLTRFRPVPNLLHFVTQKKENWYLKLQNKYNTMIKLSQYSKSEYRKNSFILENGRKKA